MHDPGVGRHDGEVVERLLAPAQERIALLVALELPVGVDLERLRRAEGVHLHGVVDDELRGLERVDAGRVTAQFAHRVAHRRQVDHGRHPGEVLHQHACRHVRDLAARLVRRHPARERLDVVAGDDLPVLVAQQVLEQDLEREREPRDVELRLQRVEPEDLVGPVADRERGAGVEAVHALTGLRKSRFAGHFSLYSAPRGNRASRSTGHRDIATRLVCQPCTGRANRNGPRGGRSRSRPVSRILSWTTIHLGPALPPISCGPPGPGRAGS